MHRIVYVRGYRPAKRLNNILNKFHLEGLKVGFVNRVTLHDKSGKANPKEQDRALKIAYEKLGCTDVVVSNGEVWQDG